MRDRVASGSRLVDRDTGIIRFMAEIPVDPGEPQVFNYSAKMADTAAYLPVGCYDSNGGAGLSRAAAYRAALGEAIERYCSSVYFREELLLGSHAEVSRRTRALSPGELALFHPTQRAFIRYAWFESDTRISWTEGRSVTRREPVLVPACLTYLPFWPFRVDEGEQAIGPSISTGQASGSSFHDALLAGLYEVVARDAFVITWLNRLPVPRIDLSSSARAMAVFRGRFERPHLRYSLHWLATDIAIPCVLCLVVDTSRQPPMICAGGAANLDPERAVIKALVEAAQTREWARVMGRGRLPRVIESDYSNLDDFEDHVFLYAYGDMRPTVEFLLAANEEVPLADIPSLPGRDVERALDAVHDRGLEVITVELTTPDVAECGYRVLKIVVPGAQQLEGDHTHRLLGGSRLYDVPPAFGTPPKDITELNPDPHPFP
jgi:ribosomal protein S12 methylthiotransferase accessory factor